MIHGRNVIGRFAGSIADLFCAERPCNARYRPRGRGFVFAIFDTFVAFVVTDSAAESA